jgi:hypothetical protein
LFSLWLGLVLTYWLLKNTTAVPTQHLIAMYSMGNTNTGHNNSNGLTDHTCLC